MAKYRKKPVVIEAVQWFQNGDHPEDSCGTFDVGDGPFQGEGKIVRYFRHPEVSGEKVCSHCLETMHEHGWIDTLEGGHTVCPRDWIITGVANERYPCKPEIFAKTYELVNEDPCKHMRRSYDTGNRVERCMECGEPLKG